MLCRPSRPCVDACFRTIPPPIRDSFERECQLRADFAYAASELRGLDACRRAPFAAARSPLIENACLPAAGRQPRRAELFSARLMIADEVCRTRRSAAAFITGAAQRCRHAHGALELPSPLVGHSRLASRARRRAPATQRRRRQARQLATNAQRILNNVKRLYVYTYLTMLAALISFFSAITLSADLAAIRRRPAAYE